MRSVEKLFTIAELFTSI